MHQAVLPPKAPRLVPLAGFVCLTWFWTACDGEVAPRPPEPGPAACEGPTGSVPTARLLTRREYQRTVRDLLGETADVTATFPKEAEVDGFDNNRTSHIANPLLVEELAKSAAQLASSARARGLSALVPCMTPGADCASVFIETFGQRAFRRPLDDAEKRTFSRLYAVTSSLGHDQALTAVIEAMLLSPQFLYRVEAYPSATEETALPLGPYELASRLSYFIWGSMPDDALLAAAKSGTLETKEGLQSEASRLLSDARAREQVRDFFSAWLGLSKYEGLVREGADQATLDSLEESLLAFTDGIFWSDDSSLEDLMTSQTVHIDQNLAPLFGQEAPETMSPFQDSGRSGLLTQPGLMALLSNPDQSSPIRRGVFVREKLFCDPVPAPPATVNNTPPDPDPSLTTRERFRVHTESSTCAACHSLIDPVGFTFEGFDALGRVRSEEFGLPIDTTGELAASPDPSLEGPLEDVHELAGRLAQSGVVAECLTRKWLTFSLGRPDQASDECSISGITERVMDRAGNLQEILLGIVASDAFRLRAPFSEETR